MWHGISLTILDSRSTHTMTELYPREEGRSVTKSQEIICQKFSGTSLGESKPRGFWRKGFERWQVAQPSTYLWQSLVIEDHQKSR